MHKVLLRKWVEVLFHPETQCCLASRLTLVLCQATDCRMDACFPKIVSCSGGALALPAVKGQDKHLVQVTQSEVFLGQERELRQSLQLRLNHFNVFNLSELKRAVGLQTSEMPDTFLLKCLIDFARERASYWW